jgi:hypothetical protein
MNEQKRLKDRVTKVTADVTPTAVVNATRERAQKASRAARSQLPATREDIMRMQDQLDRIEAALADMSQRMDALKPKRRTAATSAGGSAKPEG